jgi:hypothetical protein
VFNFYTFSGLPELEATIVQGKTDHTRRAQQVLVTAHKHVGLYGKTFIQMLVIVDIISLCIGNPLIEQTKQTDADTTGLWELDDLASVRNLPSHRSFWELISSSSILPC